MDVRQLSSILYPPTPAIARLSRGGRVSSIPARLTAGKLYPLSSILYFLGSVPFLKRAFIVRVELSDARRPVIGSMRTFITSSGISKY